MDGEGKKKKNEAKKEEVGRIITDTAVQRKGANIGLSQVSLGSGFPKTQQKRGKKRGQGAGIGLSQGTRDSGFPKTQRRKTRRARFKTCRRRTRVRGKWRNNRSRRMLRRK